MIFAQMSRVNFAKRIGRHRAMSAVLAGVILLPLLVGCSSNDQDGTGRLEGVVYNKGGMNGRSEPAEATLTATPEFKDSNQTYATETSTNGSFGLDLPAGTYELTGTLKGGSGGGQTTPQEVTVKANKTTTVEVFAIHP